MGQPPGLVLSGGLSRRMGGGDKALRRLGSKPLIAHVLERFVSQASPLAINANGEAARFSTFGLPVIPDVSADFAGPLAGILAGLRWAAAAVPQAQFLATAACDTPFFPRDLVPRLSDAAASRPGPVIAVARSGGRLHPVFGLWPISLADELATALDTGERKVTAFVEARPYIAVDFPSLDIGGKSLDPFFNANTPEDLAGAEALLLEWERQ